MGFGNLFKKVESGAGNLFKKVGLGNNLFKKVSNFVSTIPSYANSVGDNIKYVANAIQKKSDVIAPAISTIANALGQPELATAIMGAGNYIKNTGNNVNNAVSKFQGLL